MVNGVKYSLMKVQCGSVSSGIESACGSHSRRVQPLLASATKTTRFLSSKVSSTFPQPCALAAWTHPLSCLVDHRDKKMSFFTLLLSETFGVCGLTIF